MKRLGCGAAGAMLFAALAGAQQGAGEVDLASVEMGGRIESVSSGVSGYEQWAPTNLIANTPHPGWRAENPKVPQEIVISFLGRQSALIGGASLNPVTTVDAGPAKDVEIWTSTESATAGFVRAAAVTLEPEKVDQPVTFAPVEATFVKVRIVSAQPRMVNNQPSPAPAGLARVRIYEAQRAGYTPLLARNPDLAELVKGNIPRAPAAAAGPPPPAAGLSTCSAPPAVKAPARPESKRVLVVSPDDRNYTPAIWKTNRRVGNASRLVDYSIYGRLEFTRVTPPTATPAHLLRGLQIDTVVLSQVCDIGTSVSPAFKQALLAWIADGHKLIIHDSDRCGGNPSKVPDYSFLPYPFSTVNPGAAGLAGEASLIENNTLASGVSDDAAFLDMAAWVKAAGGNQNELGDSNVITKHDPRWCGQIFGKNALKKSGFVEAYARYGRGLIIYNGIDFEHVGSPAYEQLLTRELAQPFDPDNLPCTQPLGDFIIATDSAAKSQYVQAGWSYTYPLQVLPNFGYAGKVALSAAYVPADPAVSVKLSTTAVDVAAGAATATLVVTTTGAAPPKPGMVEIRGKDAATGKSNVLCLALTERTSGSISVLSGLAKDRKPTKHLEIILDASGSMKAMLGKKTRWATAQDVLKEVVTKLPADFNVGLRAYGHTLASTNPKTCTDTALVVPVGPLNPASLLAAAGHLTPRGETPLVYSILQTPGDLKQRGGGTVILITDGEESCKGDFAAAAKALEDSGLDLTLHIVGFTLKSAPAKAQLGGLAESTGGHYFGASSGEALARAVLLAAVDKLPYRVLNAAGKEVARGEAGAGKAHELPPGDYKVVVTAADQDLTTPVTVAVGKDITLSITIKGGALVADR